MLCGAHTREATEGLFLGENETKLGEKFVCVPATERKRERERVSERGMQQPPAITSALAPEREGRKKREAS